MYDFCCKVWKYTFKKLSVSPEDHPVLFSEVPFNPKPNREKTIQIMFETFSTPAVYLANQGPLALLGSSSGCNTGIVLDSGDTESYSIPVYEGHALSYATLQVNMGGHHLTESLGQMLSKQGYQFNTAHSTFNDTVRDLKEKLCYVAQDYTSELEASNNAEKSFKLPDGQEVTINEECFSCPEAIFQPSLIQSDSDAKTHMHGLHEMCYYTIMKCNGDLRRDMCGNIVLSGGNTMFPGTAARLQKELINLASTFSNIRVIDLPNRNYLAWTGGSILSSLSTFKQMWISRHEYEEHGPYIVHSKCF